MRGWKKYLENEVNSESSTNITVLAYEKCISELKIAKVKIGEFRYKESEEKFTKVEMIIRELITHLNHELFPDLALKIEDLYVWILEQMYELKISKKIEKIDPVIQVIEDLLEGFKGANK